MTLRKAENGRLGPHMVIAFAGILRSPAATSSLGGGVMTHGRLRCRASLAARSASSTTDGRREPSAWVHNGEGIGSRVHGCGDSGDASDASSSGGGRLLQGLCWTYCEAFGSNDFGREHRAHGGLAKGSRFFVVLLAKLGRAGDRAELLRLLLGRVGFGLRILLVIGGIVGCYLGLLRGSEFRCDRLLLLTVSSLQGPAGFGCCSGCGGGCY